MRSVLLLQTYWELSHIYILWLLGNECYIIKSVSLSVTICMHIKFRGLIFCSFDWQEDSWGINFCGHGGMLRRYNRCRIC